ncbi:MAG TPA: DUF6010 family protein [Thermoanaerobaculia bacterium]|nr:DUF6010 family protein [Thermoanaerobaculia bacterium]
MIRGQLLLAVWAGAALALPYLFYAHRSRHSRRVFAIGLPIAAAVYVVFAASRGTPHDLFIESLGVLLFALLAFVGFRYWSPFLALAWVAHLSWDLLLHPIGIPSYAPWWYAVTCIGFDLVVAGAIVGTSRARL